jgi:hypothetical protein
MIRQFADQTRPRHQIDSWSLLAGAPETYRLRSREHRPDVRRYVDHLFVIIWPECPVGAREPGLIAAVDALGVMVRSSSRAVAGPLRSPSGRAVDCKSYSGIVCRCGTGAAA